MALISAKTILTSLCLFHVTLAFFFFASPASIADQALVWVLGEAMGMPQTTAFNTPTPTTSLLSLVFFLIGLTDLITLSQPDEIWLLHHWSAQAPVRVLLFTLLTVFVFLTTPSTQRQGAGRLSHPVPVEAWGLGSGSGGGWDGLRNRVFFTLVFMEMMSWFWVWVTIREETKVFMQEGRKRRRASSGTDGLSYRG
ncbi:increased loss of mitochondrial DNA protein 1 [Xylariales sp. AK1849]|nr:increased loss of mitochondrial DNA protein 1 [Xylariales sp. AK1849]